MNAARWPSGTTVGPVAAMLGQRLLNIVKHFSGQRIFDPFAVELGALVDEPPSPRRPAQHVRGDGSSPQLNSPRFARLAYPKAVLGHRDES
jgi:hypothetical protein